MLKSHKFGSQLFSRLLLQQSQVFRSFSIFQYRIRSQYQNDINSSFDWNVCKDLEDVCYYFDKNYTKQVKTDDGTYSKANQFNLKDVFIQEDHFRLLEKISQVIKTFKSDNEAQYNMLVLLMKSLSEDLQYIFYISRPMYKREALNEEVINNVLEIIKEINLQISKLSPEKQKSLQGLVTSLLLNHNFIIPVLDSKKCLAKYLNLVMSIDSISTGGLLETFRAIAHLAGVEKTLRLRSKVAKITEDAKAGNLVSTLDNYLTENIEATENLESLHRLLESLEIGKSQEKRQAMVKKAYQHFIKLLESKQAGNPFDDSQTVNVLLNTLSESANWSWKETLEILTVYSAKCLQVQYVQSSGDAAICNYIGLIKNFSVQIPQAEQNSRNRVLEMLKKLTGLLKETDREELYFLLKLVNVTHYIKGSSTTTAQKIYDEIYDIFVNKSFNAKLANLKEVDMLKYVDSMTHKLSKIWEEIYPENRWHKIDIESVPLSTQILVMSYLDPLVKIPSNFFVFSEEKAAVIENNVLYYVKMTKFYEKLDKNYRNFLTDFKNSTSGLRKKLTDYSISHQVSFVKELALYSPDTFAKNKFLTVVKTVINDAFKQLGEHPASLDLEELVFMVHKLHLFEDQEIINQIRNFLNANSKHVESFAMAQIFFYFSDSGKLTEKDSDLFQEYFTDKIRTLGVQEFYPLSMAIRNIKLKTHFHQGFFESLRLRSSQPEYAGIVCEYLYHEIKNNQRKTSHIEMFLPGLKAALEKDHKYVTLVQLDRVLPYILKFVSANWMKEIYKVKLQEFLKNPKVNYLCQVYCSYTQVFDDPEIIKAMESVLMQNLHTFKPYQQTMILRSLVHRYGYNANEKLIDALLKKAKNREFYLQIKKTDSAQKVSESIDIGMLCSTFLNHCLLMRDMEPIDIMISLIRDVLQEKTDKMTGRVYHDPGRDLQNRFLLIHTTQILQGMMILKHIKKYEKQMSAIDDTIKKLEKIWQTKPTQDFKNQSYFQDEVAFFIKEKLFSKEEVAKEYAIPPYTIDFYLPKLKLAVECNGQHHYLFSKDKLIFKEKRKIEVLEAMGNKVLDISVREWRGTNTENREKLLRKKLEALGIKLM